MKRIDRQKLLLTMMAIMIVICSLSTLVIREDIRDRHRQRLDDDRQLACLLVQDTPAGNSTGDLIRKKYGCPPYSNRKTPGETPTPTTTAVR